ncbi:MAG: hypothetical protein C5B47_00305 [Verrucomicrobia bacterium]|nr:MAG: hypothetical protein C5B47_00305 [Verrucomicrobiota bacterium]
MVWFIHIRVRSNPSTTANNLTGSILVATPTLKDPNFRRTILFISYHSVKDGALGFVLNRPLEKTLGEVYYLGSADILATVPLYYGGPVAPHEINVARLNWIEQPRAAKFQSFTKLIESGNISPERVQGLRAFAGHSGWHGGQLEEEIAHKAWFVLPPSRNLIDMPNPTSAWKDTLRQMNPILKLLVEIPDDPSLN